MSNEHEKSRVELGIFCQFAEAAKLPVVAGSVKKCLPPKPDIACEIKDEGLVRFELTEACAPEFAELRSRLEDCDKFAWGEDGSHITLSKKLQKKYNVKEPVELVIYTNAATAQPDDVLVLRLQSVLKDGRGYFRRVWLFGDCVHEL